MLKKIFIVYVLTIFCFACEKQSDFNKLTRTISFSSEVAVVNENFRVLLKVENTTNEKIKVNIYENWIDMFLLKITWYYSGINIFEDQALRFIKDVDYHTKESQELVLKPKESYEIALTGLIKLEKQFIQLNIGDSNDYYYCNLDKGLNGIDSIEDLSFHINGCWSPVKANSVEEFLYNGCFYLENRMQIIDASSE